jgi:hypothetical protein
MMGDGRWVDGTKERGPCADYVQNRALTEQNRGPTVGEYTVFGHRRGIKTIRRGATVKANDFYGSLASI